MTTPEVAVIPVAGLGTRWLPLTRSVPKELLPVWRASAASYAVREAFEAGIREIVFVVSPGKPEVAEHFEPDTVLLRELEARGRGHLLAPLAELWSKLTIRTAVQNEALGLGHAVACARPVVGERPFLLLLPDEILLSKPGASHQLVRTSAALGGASTVLLMEVKRESTGRYGIATVSSPNADGVVRIEGLVEKPDPAVAPSNLAIIGRYVLTPEIFEILEHTKRGYGGEIQLTDGLAELAARHPVYATRFDGTRYDVGRPEGLLVAAVDMALRDPEVGESVGHALRRLLDARMG